MALTVFNITMTSLPILIYGVFEKHIPEEDLMKKPALYKSVFNR